jgi:hypothetical protein
MSWALRASNILEVASWWGVLGEPGWGGEQLDRIGLLKHDPGLSVSVEAGGVVPAGHIEVLTDALPSQEEDGDFAGLRLFDPLALKGALPLFVLQRHLVIESQKPSGKHPGGDLKFLHKILPHVKDEEVFDGKHLVLECGLSSQVLEVELPTRLVEDYLLGGAAHVLEGESVVPDELDDGLVVEVGAIVEDQVLSLEHEDRGCFLLLLFIILDY